MNPESKSRGREDFDDDGRWRERRSGREERETETAREEVCSSNASPVRIKCHTVDS